MSSHQQSNETDNEEVKPHIVIEAVIKDDFCNYKFDVNAGIGVGDTHSVKGKGIIDHDMRLAFARFSAHLAYIDEAFKLSGVEIPNIDSMHNHELTGRYTVTGFKIKGGSDNESIVLIGTKYLGTVGGRMELETPAIPIDTLSSYMWYNELKVEADKARLEVELYMAGKCTPVESEEKEDPDQLKITDQLKSEAELGAKKARRKKKGEQPAGAGDDDLESGRVK